MATMTYLGIPYDRAPVARSNMTHDELLAWMADMGTTDCCHASKPRFPAPGRVFFCDGCSKGWRFDGRRGWWLEL